jgi:flagellar basal-body rod protein FlgG
MILFFVPLYIAASGMQSQQNNVEAIAHNLANMSTTGYKRRRVSQQDLLYIRRRSPGSTTSNAGTLAPSGLEVGLGVKSVGTYKVLEQGVPTQTFNPYHLTIQGEGYFQVQRADGSIAYTRDGSFGLSPERVIVNKDGLTVQPGITIPQNALGVNINEQGEVFARIDGTVGEQRVGQIELATFPNPGGLEDIGDNLALETPASGTPLLGTPGGSGYGTLLQSYLEGSNVNPVSEITGLIMSQRAYEMNTKVIQAADQMLSSIGQMR